MYIEIRIIGHLKPDWSEWFGDLIIANEANGETIPNGQIPDQSTPLGLLNRLHGLNLKLLSISTIRSDVKD